MTAPLHDALAPDDDAFVRTAVRGLRVPQHHDDFWEVLHAELEMAGDVMTAQGLLVEPEVPPLVVELPPTDRDPEHLEWNPAAAPVEPPRGPRPAPVDPARRPGPTAHPPRREPLRAPAAPAAAALTGAPAPAALPARSAPGRPAGVESGVRRMGRADRPAPTAHRVPRYVEPDPAERDVGLLPFDMRRRSNAVLVAVAAAAAIVAVLAALTLVRQRSGDGAVPTSTTVVEQQPVELDDPLGALPSD